MRLRWKDVISEYNYSMLKEHRMVTRQNNALKAKKVKNAGGTKKTKRRKNRSQK
jgi:hypothetical protein